MKTFVSVAGIIAMLLSSMIIARSEEYYDFNYFHLQPSFRELVTGRDAFKDHYMKTVNYTANLQTPGFIRKSVKNVRVYNQKLGQYEVDALVRLKWLEGITFETGRDLDFAINGHNRGFFTIRLPDQIAFTRDGRFRIDLQNRLVTLSGNYPVVNEDGGYIFVIDPGGDFSISRTGGLYNNNEFIGRLKITIFKTIKDMDQYLVPMGGTIFVLTNEVETLEGYEHYSILQGYIQRSNTFKSNDGPLYKNFFQASNSAMSSLLDIQKTNFSILQP